MVITLSFFSFLSPPVFFQTKTLETINPSPSLGLACVDGGRRPRTCGCGQSLGAWSSAVCGEAGAQGLQGLLSLPGPSPPRLQKRLSAGCATSSSQARSAPKAEGCASRQQKRLARLGGFPKVSFGLGEARRGPVSQSEKEGRPSTAGSLRSGVAGISTPIICRMRPG